MSCKTSTPLLSPNPPFPVVTRHAPPQADTNRLTELTGRTEKTRLRQFRPYSAFKDSGIEWLREIPAHWHLKRLKDCVARLESGGTPESNNDRYWTGEGQGIPWVAISDMTRGFHLHATTKWITEEGRRSKRLRILPVGTLLYSMYASLGKVALLETEAVINQAILGVIPRSRMARRDYLRWWFEFMQVHVQMLSSSNTQDNLSAERVRNMPVVLPPAVKEQQAIAVFLDRETAKVDALVEKKERLIELLQEKRTALITRAVTRGLDPNVPMQDSGVYWLREIPAHWEVKKWRYCCQIAEGQVTPDEEQFRERILIAPNHVESGTGRILRLESVYEQGAISGKYLVAPGNIIYSKIRPALNQVCIAAGNWLCSADMYPISITESRLHMRFLLYFMLSPPFVRLMVDESMRVAMPKVNRDSLASCPVLVPEPVEQLKLVAVLDRETSRIDALIARVEEAIDHLNEYRTALISAAVTGKIDVRNEAA